MNRALQVSEMKFEDEGRIFKAVYKAVLDAIRPAGQRLENVAAGVQNAERHYTIEPMQFIPAAAPQPSAPPQAAGTALPADAYTWQQEHRAPAMSFSEAQRVLHPAASTAPMDTSPVEYAPAQPENSPVREALAADAGPEAVQPDGPMVRYGDALERRIAAVEEASGRLQRLHHFVSESLRHLPSPTLVCDAAGRVLLANSAAAQHLALAEEALPGRHIGQLLGDLTEPQTGKALRPARSNKWVCRGKLCMLCPLEKIPWSAAVLRPSAPENVLGIRSSE